MSENLRFAQTFSKLGSSPLLTSLFGCFPVGSLFTLHELPNNSSNGELDQQKDGVKDSTKLNKNVSTQTEWTKWRAVGFLNSNTLDYN
jgi:hypothetical protein